MQLVTHHTDEGQHMALVVKTRRKWMHLLYVGNTRLKRVPMTERKFFKTSVEATKKQIAQFNRIARKFGASKKVVK